MNENPTRITNPISLDQFNDGHIYVLPELSFIQSHLFSKIAFTDLLVIKLPSSRGFSDYRKYIKHEKPDPDDIRRNEDHEKYASLDNTLREFPEFRQAHGECGVDNTHYLIVHKLQYRRLREAGLIAVPESRFVMVSQPFLRFFSRMIPAIIQQRVSGTSLWDMYDFDADELRAEWRPHLPGISNQLKALMDSPLLNHINWNIENLIFNRSTEQIYYVDSKPSTMFSRSHNQHNINGIKDVFII